MFTSTETKNDFLSRNRYHFSAALQRKGDSLRIKADPVAVGLLQIEAKALAIAEAEKCIKESAKALRRKKPDLASVELHLREALNFVRTARVFS